MQRSTRNVFLHPGECCFSVGKVHLHTVLGSCVAITLWHPQMRVGGMCHFVLPEHPYGATTKTTLPGYYASGAMALFERAARALGLPLLQFQGKIFGGATVPGLPASVAAGSPGPRNVATAMTMLTDRGIEIVAANVGDCSSRRIVMDLKNGEVWMRQQPIDENTFAILAKKPDGTEQ